MDIIYRIENITINNHGTNGMNTLCCDISGVTQKICGDGNANNNNVFSNSAGTSKYAYLTEAFEELSLSHRAKVLSLVAKLLDEQENKN